MQWVLQFAIEIEPVSSFLIEQLSAAMSQQLVNTNLELEGVGFPLLEQLAVAITVERARQSTKDQEDDCQETMNLTNVIFSLALFADRTLPSDTFLKPTFWRISS